MKKQIMLLFVIYSLIIIQHAISQDNPSYYDVSGSWIACHTVENHPEAPDGPFFSITFVPLDQSNTKWSLNVSGFVGSLEGLQIPGVGSDSSFTDYVGVAEKTENNKYESKSIGYILDASKNALYYTFVYVTSYFTTSNTMRGDVSFTLYLPSQDKNMDGIPDADEIPVGYDTTAWYYTRTTQIPPLKIPGWKPLHGDVWVTDDMSSTQNLIEGCDEDLPTDASLAIHWYVEDADIQNCHIYVSVDGGDFEYLCQTVSAEDHVFEWKAGLLLYMNPNYSCGPRFGHDYAFRVYVITASGDPFFVGPYTTPSFVHFQEATIPPMTEVDMFAMLENFDQALNAQDLSKMETYLCDGFIFDYVPYTPEIEGKNVFLSFMQVSNQKYANTHLQRKQVLASSTTKNVLVMESVFSGTHTESGLPVQWPSLQILEFEGNQMSKCTEYADHGAIMMQLGLMPSPGTPPSKPSFMMPDPVPTDQIALEAAQEILSYWQDRNLVEYSKKIHPDGSFLTAMGLSLNREELMGLLDHMLQAVPDMVNEEKRIIELNDGWVLGEVVMDGTSTGPYLGVPPTGKTFNIRYAALYHFDENGLMTNFELYWDLVTLFTQIGVLPRSVSEPVPPSEAEMMAALVGFAKEIDNRDLEKIATFFTEDALYQFNPYKLYLPGHEAIKSFFNTLFETYPIFSGTPDFVLFENNEIFVKVVLNNSLDAVRIATHPVFFIWEFRGDKVFRVSEYLDTAIGLRQWGMMPPFDIPPMEPSFPLPDPVPSNLSPMDATKKLFELWKNQNMLQFSQMINPDGVFMTAMETTMNREQLIGVMEHFIASAPNMNHKASRYIDFGDGWIAMEGTAQGINTGPYFGIPATGKSYSFKYLGLTHFDENGLLTNFELIYDTVDFLTQIGVIPSSN